MKIQVDFVDLKISFFNQTNNFFFYVMHRKKLSEFLFSGDLKLNYKKFFFRMKKYARFKILIIILKILNLFTEKTLDFYGKKNFKYYYYYY